MLIYTSEKLEVILEIFSVRDLDHKLRKSVESNQSRKKSYNHRIQFTELRNQSLLGQEKLIFNLTLDEYWFDRMFDKLFGSGKDEEIERLKSILDDKEKKIEDLKLELKEKEKDLKNKAKRKEEKLERERKRAKEAVTEKQKSDKKLKEAKHKIESLEDRIRNLEEQSEEIMAVGEVKVLGREETISLLDELGGLRSDDNSLVTHYIRNPEEAGDNEVVRILRKIDSDVGYVYLRDRFKTLNCILVPPLPVEKEFHRGGELKLGKIRKLLKSDLRLFFVSVHAGKSAVGLLEGPHFESFNLVRDRVKGKHSKGGFSQGRFQRRREKQVKKHLQEVIEKVESSAMDVDYILLDGNKEMVSKLRNELSVDVPLIERSLGIGKVNGRDKKDYAGKVWSSKLYIL